MRRIRIWARLLGVESGHRGPSVRNVTSGQVALELAHEHLLPAELFGDGMAALRDDGLADARGDGAMLGRLAA